MNKQDPSRNAPEEVDAYLKNLPEDMRKSLDRLRSIIRDSVPGCTERVSYRIPVFRLGRDLVGISAHKNHCSLHTMSPSFMKERKEVLKDLKVSGATIHFTPENPLAEKIIVQLLHERLKELNR